MKDNNSINEAECEKAHLTNMQELFDKLPMAMSMRTYFFNSCLLYTSDAADE